MTETRLDVRTQHPYPVSVGHGIRSRIDQLLGDSQRVALIHPPTLHPLATELRDCLAAAGGDVHLMVVPDAEQAKTSEVLVSCWSELGSAGFTRSDAVIGLGGGATTDLAGFVAATWLRGVKLITVPTSLLGMVDAAIGGKTGINTAHGKNLVGAFHEPAAVLCDLDLLQTLPVDDLRSGLAEVIKCGFIADPQILTLVEKDPRQALDPTSAVLRELIERAIRVKATIVSADLRESTSRGNQIGRELLNYGHTLAHAVEQREHYRWRHGEAVSVGLLFAAELSRLAGHLDVETTDRHSAVLTSVGLPISYPADAFDDLLAAMALDKKSRGVTLRFVILDALAEASILAGPGRDLLEAAYARVTAV